jgi:hypothetical protein
MNTNEQEIENILRNPPRVTVPSGLKERLIADLPRRRASERSVDVATPHGSWVRRWLPLLLPGSLALGCGVVLTIQRLEISDLKASVQSLGSVPTTPASAQSTEAPIGSGVANIDEGSGSDELTRLKETAQKLRSEISALEQLATENQQLRKELAKPAPVAGLTDEEQKALQDAKDRADRIHCVNNLKQIGLAIRMWSLDNQDKIAPDFLSMSNELSTPKILACPADTAHPAADGWAAFSAANCSYEYFPNDGKADQNLEKILTRCPIHGSIGLLDGSVQMSVMKNHPEYVVRGDDGQLYFHVPAQPGSANPQPNESKNP